MTQQNNYLYDALKSEEEYSLERLAGFNSQDANWHYYRGRLDTARYMLGLLEHMAAKENEKRAGD